MLGAGEGAIFSFHEWLYFLDQKFCVTVRAAPAKLCHMGGRIFADACFRVVHADDDERLDGASVNTLVRRVSNMPVLSGNE